MKTGSEFNLAALSGDPALREKLIAMEQQDNDSVNTGFVQSTAHRSSGKRSRDAVVDSVIQAMEMTAAQQRLNDRIAELDQAALRALEANERALEEAQRQQERLLERAHVITMPDGTEARVFRDGEDVRLEDGTQLDPALLDADDLPATATSWEAFSENRDQISELEAERQAIEDYRGTLADVDEFLETNPDDEMVAELDGALSSMPPAVRSQLPAETVVAPAADQTAAQPAPTEPVMSRQGLGL